MSEVIKELELKGRFERIPFGGCWLWTGAVTGKGYGCLSRGRYAHRLFYEETYGPTPTGMQVCHKCDIKCCVNPEHLFLGTNLDNTVDYLNKFGWFNGNTEKTECKRGHLFSSENTYTFVDKAGKTHRHCKTCWKLRQA